MGWAVLGQKARAALPCLDFGLDYRMGMMQQVRVPGGGGPGQAGGAPRDVEVAPTRCGFLYIMERCGWSVWVFWQLVRLPAYVSPW